MQQLQAGYTNNRWSHHVLSRRVAVLVASRGRPDLVERTVTSIRARSRGQIDIIVAECGTAPEQRSPHASVFYEDPQNEKGKTYCHDQAYRKALARGGYDYYYVVMNDALFEGHESIDPLALLVDQMELSPHLGMIAPTNYGKGAEFPGAMNRTLPPGGPGGGGGGKQPSAAGWRLAAVVDYLAILIRGKALVKTGFLNPDFRYSQGAEHELAYRMWRSGYGVAYSDLVSIRHLGGSTFGVAGTATVSRVVYLEKSIRFAKEYMERVYGKEWDQRFWEATLWQPVPYNVFAWWRRTFTSVLEKLDAGTHSIRPD